MGKISELIENFHQTGKFSELMERLDVLICIRNEYMKDDWRIVGVCGYITIKDYYGEFRLLW